MIRIPDTVCIHMVKSIPSYYGTYYMFFLKKIILYNPQYPWYEMLICLRFSFTEANSTPTAPPQGITVQCNIFIQYFIVHKINSSSASYWVSAAPKRWSKNTTNNLSIFHVNSFRSFFSTSFLQQIFFDLVVVFGLTVHIVKILNIYTMLSCTHL